MPEMQGRPRVSQGRGSSRLSCLRTELSCARRHTDNAHRRGDSARVRTRTLAIAGLLFTRAAAAQGSASSDGALFLLLPVGAQTVGMAQATVAERLGSESIWSNPAAIARQEKREVAIHHSETIAARGDVITVLIPKKNVGAFAASVNVLDFGNQQITDPGGTPIGLVLPRNLLFAGTFGASIGGSLSVGVTYKRLQYRVDCSGQCANVTTFSATSSAVDLGAQYDVPGDSSIRLGAAIRSVGTRLQITDRERADPLPARVEVGVSYRPGMVRHYVSDIDVHLAGDVVATE